jgi:glycoside hydrolase-like protein
VRRLATPLLAAALGALAACGGDVTGPRAAPPPQTPTTPTVPNAAHPGFDLAVYPGDAAVGAWASSAPYEWMGYYLPAPCHRDATFVGKRAAIAAAGLGVAVLYVGQQTWDGVPVLDGAAERTAGLRALASAVTCSRTLLDAAQGDAEARDAVARAAADGFPDGTVIFLDLEPMTITAAMRSYYRSWVARVAADGRYRPGVYAHVSNAADIHADVGDLPFWVASTRSFSLAAAPTGVGLAFAKVWQGALDVSRSWGGVTLTIDESVAERKSPSGP